eukprot:845656-Rhodomonas_salina.4
MTRIPPTVTRPERQRRSRHHCDASLAKPESRVFIRKAHRDSDIKQIASMSDECSESTDSKVVSAAVRNWH